MGGRWNKQSAALRHEDGNDAMREWRWRCYADHLQDMGYDLNGGDSTSDEPVPHAEAPDANTPESSVAL